jgi:hypothetical protein
MYGLAGHATHFAGLFATAGLCLLWPRTSRRRLSCVVASGILFGLAILMKQQAALFALWGLAVLMFSSPVGAGAAGKVRGLAAYSLGVVAPFLITCLVLWRAGVLEKFWFWTVSYAAAYVSVVPLTDAPVLFWDGFSQAVATGWWLWTLAAIGLVVIWRGKRKPGFRFELTGFALASFLTTCPGYYFRIHYFILMVPALALLAACAFNAIRSSPKLKAATANALVGLVFVLSLAWNVWENRNFWFNLTPRQVSRVIYGANPFLEAGLVADYIRTNSTSSDKVAVLGSEPEIHFLSRRHSATSYIYIYSLMEPQPFAHQMQLEMISQIEQARPKFVVVATANLSWLQRPGSDATITRWWPDFSRQNYTIVGIAEIVSLTETRVVWGRDALSRNPTSDSLLLTYQRTDTLPARPD